MRTALKVMMGAALAAAGTPAWAASEEAVSIEVAAEELAPGGFVWNDPGTAEPVTVVVSLPLQRAYVFRGPAMVAATAVSTGTYDKPTPTGVYPILQKEVKHRSNLYDSSMPFMQRLTWDGVALHAGRNPGFPASHGCVRMPAAFARKLFAVTDIGTTVVVTDDALVDAVLDPELLRTDAMRANEAQLEALRAAAYPKARPTLIAGN